MNTILGQETRVIKTRSVEAGVTTTGGHLWPAKFLVGSRWVSPLSAAPWAIEPLDRSTPEILKVLRGDFFCMPFGGNATVHRGERHPVHGETANRRWKAEAAADNLTLHFSLKTRAAGKGVELVSRSGKSARVPLDPTFLAGR